MKASEIAKPDSKLFEGCFVYCKDKVVYLKEFRKETKIAVIIEDYKSSMKTKEVNTESLFIIGTRL